MSEWVLAYGSTQLDESAGTESKQRGFLPQKEDCSAVDEFCGRTENSYRGACYLAHRNVYILVHCGGLGFPFFLPLICMDLGFEAMRTRKLTGHMEHGGVPFSYCVIFLSCIFFCSCACPELGLMGRFVMVMA